MTTEEIKVMEAWCDWACGNCERTNIKWKAARLGYIRGVYETERKFQLNKPGHIHKWESEGTGVFKCYYCDRYSDE